MILLNGYEISLSGKFSIKFSVISDPEPNHCIVFEDSNGSIILGYSNRPTSLIAD